MLFSSVTFLFLFLPAVILLYYILPRKLRNALLLLASILFYAWGEPRYLIVMFAVILINYFGALLIASSQKYSKFWLVLTILGNLGFLFYFKYIDFFIENLNLIFKSKIPLLNIALPLGISFYTFQALSYSIDVYRKQVLPQKKLYKLALYITLFPQLIAGPIVKYHDIVNQIDNREETVDKVYYGIRRFIIGLAKKVLIANILGEIADKVFTQLVENGGVSVGVAWLGGMARTLQVYYDFSGYSDMAIGLGSIFGFKFWENFNYPYISKSMSEYWRRWHISLGTWCKDYIYIPMGGSRVASWRIYFNLFVLFFVIGLWHGATWNFITFGALNASFIILERFTGYNKKSIHGVKVILQYVYIIPIFVLNAVLANTGTINHSFMHIKNLLGILVPKNINYGFSYYLDRIGMIVFAVAVLCCIPIFKSILEWGKKYCIIKVAVDIWFVILLLLCCTQLAASTYNPFIYFRF